jgi:two-component system OmpR family response regulator
VLRGWIFIERALFHAMTKHILIIEDDTEVRSTLQRWLSLDGFQVTALSSGARVTEVLSRNEIDLILLDIGLPDIDGLTLTRRIREQHNADIIIISGRGDLIDRVVGLEAGADDYVTKPFEPREIVARVRSVLRRSDRKAGRQESQANGNGPHRYSFDGWVVDMHTYSLEDLQGASVCLTSGEFTLLREFVLNANRVLSRDRLIELTAGRESPAFDRSIDVRIGRLRRKLNDSPREPRYIKTVRNGGYIFVGRPIAA